MGLIYRAINKVNGKSYVGKTSIGLDKRKSKHRADGKSKPYASLFYRAAEKYGWDSFEWEVLYEGEDYSDHEYRFIIEYGDYNIIRDENLTDWMKNNPRKDEISKTFSEAQIARRQKRYYEVSKDVANDFNAGLTTREIYKKYKISHILFSRVVEEYRLDINLHRTKFLSKLKENKQVKEPKKKSFSDSWMNAHKDLNKGISNLNWTGYWVTPLGKYEMLEDAACSIGMGTRPLSKLCKNDSKPISNLQIAHNEWLKENGVKTGTIPKDLGFTFESIK